MPGTSFEELALDLGADSMRVVYEDPTQQAEKRKLLALIEGEASEDFSSSPVAAKEAKRRKVIPRKTKSSGRTPGF